MAKLTHEQIEKEVKDKGYTLVDDSNYTNMNSRIIIRCEKGHLVETCLQDFRKTSFTCPICDSNVNFINPREIPKKNGYRIIAFDQATEKFGISIFENNKLIFYSLMSFSGPLILRLTKIRKFVKDTIIKNWEPDLVIMEDIQYQQNGILTFKVLSMLLGILQELFYEEGIEFECVSPNVWRKYSGTNGKNRKEEKLLSIAKVKEKFNITVQDDIAEAILIGSYGAKTHPIKITMAFGGGADGIK